MTRLETLAAHIFAALLALRSQNTPNDVIAAEAVEKAQALESALDVAQPQPTS